MTRTTPVVGTADFASPVDSQVRLLTKVARMYHEQGIRQADIADALHVSQTKVSRLLKRAAAAGIVRTTVVVAPGVHTELEEELERRFGLREAIVADTDGEDDERDILASLGSVAAGHLEATLSGGERIGVASWSQTLLAMVDRMRPFKTPVADDVVQLLGGVGSSEVQNHSHRLLRDLARMLGATPVFLQAPALVADRSIRDGLLQDTSLAEVTARWRSLTMALVGIGSIEPSPLLAESGNAFAPYDQERLLAAGAVGNVCYHFFTADGTTIAGDLDSRTVSIPAAEFLAIPRRIGVAGGRRKRATIHAALLGGWINVLVTDVDTARFLIERRT